MLGSESTKSDLVVTDSGEGVCVDPGEREPSWKPGAWPVRKGKRAAVGSKQWRRKDIATRPLGQETDSPQLQEMVMHRVSAIVHCTAVI